MEKAFEVQKQVRNDVQTLKTYMTDLQNWEAEMKRKEAALNGVFEQDLPPVRSKLKRERPILKPKKLEKRILSSDYQSWEKFDADKACEEVDMEEIGPTSLDSKESQEEKLKKLREEAQYEKERGNTYVKQEKWDEAISCYTRAIDLVKDDAIYYANRGFCYLKKDSLHQAETDCTEALRIDPTYVKAFQRRAAARELLGSLKSASNDLIEVLRLEPHNNAARQQLEAIKAKMGTKGTKSKSSPTSSPLFEMKPIFAKTTANFVVYSKEPVNSKTPVNDDEEKWKDGKDEGITVMKPVKKPPHLRSKRALKNVPIYEVQLGKVYPEKPSTNTVELKEKDHGDSNNNDSLNKVDAKNTLNNVVDDKGKGDTLSSIPESQKLIEDAVLTEKFCIETMVAPVNSVQFMSDWKYYKGNMKARSDYLSIIDPSRIPSIFENALESDVVSDIVRILHTNRSTRPALRYLQAMSQVKRFSALAMFLTSEDKILLNELLYHCKIVENATEKEIEDLKNKYEV